MLEQQLPWPISQLCKLSGEDDQIILDPDMDRAVADEFAGIGLLVLVIFIISVYSSIHFLVNLLGGLHVIATAVGLFWGLMIANIYYLLLFTITPPILIGKEHNIRGVPREETTEKKALSRLSLLFRLLFVILLAMVIAQPWLVTLFDTSKLIEQTRQDYRTAFVRLADSVLLSQNEAVAANQRAVICQRVDDLLAANNFYTLRVQLINSHYPMSWLVTFIVVLFFVIPIGLKYRIRNTSKFYQLKKQKEEGLVLKEYERFKERYTLVLAERFGISTAWYESCIDPPFNTRKKNNEQEQADQNELLAKIYNNEEESEGNKYLLRETIS